MTTPTPPTELRRLADALADPQRWTRLHDDDCDKAAAILRCLAEVQPIPEQDAKDALRYRWLRDCTPAVDIEKTIYKTSPDGKYMLAGETLDAAIDAAMKGAAPDGISS